jgi:hypothetical protein
MGFVRLTLWYLDIDVTFLRLALYYFFTLLPQKPCPMTPDAFLEKCRGIFTPHLDLFKQLLAAMVQTLTDGCGDLDVFNATVEFF